MAQTPREGGSPGESITLEMLGQQLRELTLAVSSHGETLQRLQASSQASVPSPEPPPNRGLGLVTEETSGAHEHGSHQEEPHAPGEAITGASAAELVAALTETLRGAVTQGEGPQRNLSARAKTLADLLRNAPKYDGYTDLWLWKKRIMEYLRRRGVTEERTAVDILQEACEKSASEYLGSVEWPIEHIDTFWEVMEARFSRDAFARMADYENLRQRVGQSYRKYADIMMERAYGLGIPPASMLRKFLRTMLRSAELSPFVLPQMSQYRDVRSLAAAVEQLASEEFMQEAKWKPSGTSTKPASTAKCRLCGRTGHFAAACPRRKLAHTAPVGAQAGAQAQAVAQLEEDYVEEYAADMDAEECHEWLEEYAVDDCCDPAVGCADIEVAPAEKRPNDARYEEALKRLRTHRPEGPSRTLPEQLPGPPHEGPRPFGKGPQAAWTSSSGPARPQPSSLRPVPLRGYRSAVSEQHRPLLPLRIQRNVDGVKPLRRVLQGTVDVPATTLMGLVLRASQRPQELAGQWMQQAEAEARNLLGTTGPSADSAGQEVGTVELCEDEPVVNPLTSNMTTRQVGYMPVQLGSSKETWWALVDTGAHVSVISAGLAHYLQLFSPNMENVEPAGFSVTGYNDVPSYMPVLATQLRLGARGEDQERWCPVHLCVLDTNRYKFIIGVDLLTQWRFVYDDPSRRLFLEAKGVKFSLPLADKQFAFNARSIRTYHQALDQVQPGANVIEVAALEEEPVSVEAMMDEVEANRYENELSWECTNYCKSVVDEAIWQGEDNVSPPKEQLVPLLWLAELAGHATGQQVEVGEQPLTQCTYSSLDDVDIEDKKSEKSENIGISENFPLSLRELPAAAEISAAQFQDIQEVHTVLPQQTAAGEMGMADLPREDSRSLTEEQLAAFLTEHGLERDSEEGKSPLARRAAKLKAALAGNPELIDPTRTAGERQQAMQMLLSVADVFATELTDLAVAADTEEFTIDTREAPPIKQKAFRMGLKEVEFLNKTILGQLEADIIRKSMSPWRSPAFVAYARHYGTEGPPKMRKVIDYRKLNRVTREDSYPLPDIPELLEWFSTGVYFGAVDLKSGYWQAQTAEKDRAKTAFVVPGSLHEYKRVPFGVKNAPAFFQRSITNVLASNHITTSRGFVDDLMTKGVTWEEYLASQRELLEALKKHHWLVTFAKVRIGYTEISVLGHRVGHQMIKPDPEKIAAIRRLQPPTTVSGVRAFLGLVGYYRRFIPHFARIAQPLTALTVKEQPFEWKEPQEQAFTTLQQQLTDFTLLRTPTAEGRFRLYTDFSSGAIGAALHQVQDGVEYPIAFASRLCRGAEKTLGSAEGELCALVYALGKFRPYVGYDSFDIVTDSQALTSLKTNQNLSSKLVRWAVLLSEFNYTLVHKAGTTHKNADGLSRCEQLDEESACSHVHVWALSQEADFLADDWIACTGLGMHGDSPANMILELNTLRAALPRGCSICTKTTPGRMATCGRCGMRVHHGCIGEGRPPPCYWYCQWCTELINSQGPADITEDAELLRYLLGGAKPPGYTTSEAQQVSAHYTIRRGQLLVEVSGGYRIFPTQYERRLLIEEYHESLMHAGWRGTLEALRDKYYWAGMEADVRSYCQQCLSCQLEQAIFRRADVLGGHLSASQPRVAWSMDCAPNIMTQDGHRLSILIIVDDFTRFVVAIPLPKLDSKTVSKVFTERILAVYGRPRRVRTDGGREFAGDFEQLLASLGIEKITTAPLAPWTNGRAERMVREVKSLLRRSLHVATGADWETLLPWVVASINATVSRTVGMSPHEVFFGEPPSPLVPQDVGPPVMIQVGEEGAADVTQYVRVIKERLRRLRARAREIQTHYESGVEQDYQEYPVAGRQYAGDQQLARKRQPSHYREGSLVMVKRMRGAMGSAGHHFSMRATGPFIVIRDLGQQLLLQGPTGARKQQHKSNCLPFRGPGT